MPRISKRAEEDDNKTGIIDNPYNLTGDMDSDILKIVKNNLIEKDSDIRKTVLDWVIKNNKNNMFFHYGLDKYFPEEAKIVAQEMADKGQIEQIFRLKLNEKYPEIMGKISNQVHDYALQLARNGDKDRFYSYGIDKIYPDMIKLLESIYESKKEEKLKEDISKTHGYFPTYESAENAAINDPMSFFSAIGELQFPTLVQTAAKNLAYMHPAVFFIMHLHDKFPNYLRPAAFRLLEDRPSLFFTMDLFNNGVDFIDRRTAAVYLIKNNPNLFNKLLVNLDEFRSLRPMYLEEINKRK